MFSKTQRRPSWPLASEQGKARQRSKEGQILQGLKDHSKKLGLSKQNRTSSEGSELNRNIQLWKWTRLLHFFVENRSEEAWGGNWTQVRKLLNWSR